MTDRWKELENRVAALFGGNRVQRVKMSGDLFDWSTSAPDVLVTDLNLVIDCKAHKKADIDSKMRTVQQKYCQHGETPCVVTQTPHGTPWATVPAVWLATILSERRSQH